MRKEGADARTPAPLALNATTDRRLDPAYLIISFLLSLFGPYINVYVYIMNNKGLPVFLEFLYANVLSVNESSL